METMLSFLNEKSRNLTSPLRLTPPNLSPLIAPPARTSSSAKWKTWIEVHSTKDSMRAALLLGAQAYFLGQSFYHLTHIFPQSLKFRSRTSKVNPLWSHQVKQSAIKPGDHIYTWTAGCVYSHHGIYVAKNMVVHLSASEHGSSGSINSLFSGFIVSSPIHQASCSIPWCGFHGCGNGVVVFCLDCFSRNRSLYLFQYEVGTYAFFLKLRGGTCTTAKSDPPGPVIERAMHLLKYGFGPYDVVMKNCEDFALYCKTGLAVHNDQDLPSGIGGKVNSWLVLPLSVIVSMTLVRFMGTPIVASVALVSHLLNRYASDIGVRVDALPVKFRRLPLHFLDVENIRTRTESMMAVLNSPELKRIEDEINAGH
uniref:protein LEAD-SENSITIVE 1-like n=1 Tax=Erigeron canadensis TaxID=72917 RepID=UPI001CB8DC1C|nr:protein LEAD-SENSITIVE 1-like [Erigeron canadensis]